MHVKRAVIRRWVTFQQRRCDLIPRNDAARRSRQEVQNIEFQRCKVDGLIAFPDLSGPNVHLYVSESPKEIGGRIEPAGAAQNGTNPRQQFIRIEWLGNVIIGAGFQSENAIVPVIAGSKEYNRLRNSFSQLLKECEAVHNRQHDIEDDQVMLALQGTRQAGLPIIRVIEPVTHLGEKLLHHVAQLGVIVDEQ